MDVHTFLVADPNPRFLEKSEEILQEAGYRMAAASNGIDARAYLERDRPTGVLAFISLEGLDGVSLCRHVKEQFQNHIPVIIMAPEAPESIAIAEAAGADNVLFRPVKRTELIFCARSLIRLSALLSERDELIPPAGLEPAPSGIRASHFEFFKAFLTVEIKRARRYGFPLSLMLVSLDRMDEIEGSYGEGELRHVLAGLARAIQRSVRDIDIPVTLRDDSILVLMPHTDRDGAYAVAERVRERIRRSVYQEGELFIQPTISIGQTSYLRTTDKNFSQVIRRASQAMRTAARQGGDQVVVL
jgi:diguanylate cyclase (GGDEF)-like protein